MLAACRDVHVLDRHTGVEFPVLFMYPSHEPEHPVQLGPYTQSLARDAAMATGTYPVVVISHGTGGSHLVYRDLARHLARNGYIVALPEHPGNNRNNNTLANTAINLTNRPRHIRLVIDEACENQFCAPHLKANTVAVIGHSLGGYTALAVAGGVPRAYPHETPDRQAREIEVTTDERVKALVLLAPASVWFMTPGALSGVAIPLLMLTAEKDPHTPPEHAEIVKQGVTDGALIEHKIIPNAGHFSFLSPFPEAMTTPTFAPSQDPAGFDRALFHTEMNALILAFLDRVLSTERSRTRPAEC